MPGFNWTKMSKTPAGALERKQGKMPLEELSTLFDKQASRDLDRGNMWTELVRDITADLHDIADGSESAAERIIDKHQDFLKEEIALNDRREQMAYVIALARAIIRRREKGN